MNPQIRSIEKFIEKTEKTYEVEYGDFRRKVSQYLLRLENELGGRKINKHAGLLIQEIRRRIVYQPEADIEAARALAVRLACELMANFQEATA